MDKDTKAFLLTRAEARRAWDNGEPKLPVPKAVKLAQTVVKRFERAQFKHMERVGKRFERLRMKTFNAIHFGTEKQARAAVEKLEAFK